MIKQVNYKHLTLDTDLILQDKRMFNLVHLKQEEGWRPNRAIIVTQINFFSAQREHEGIISPSKRIIDITQARRLDAKDLIRGIRNKKGY